MSAAELAKQVSYRFECKKDRLNQTQDNGIKVTFAIHPDDMPASLYSDLMGQRYVAVLVPLADDETPRLPDPAKPKNYVAAAKLLSQDTGFWEYCNAANIHEAEIFIENRCFVNSCAEIKDGTPAGKHFSALFAQYQEWASHQYK